MKIPGSRHGILASGSACESICGRLSVGVQDMWAMPGLQRTWPESFE